MSEMDSVIIEVTLTIVTLCFWNLLWRYIRLVLPTCSLLTKIFGSPEATKLKDNLPTRFEMYKY
jgi:hypothetical protein